MRTQEAGVSGVAASSGALAGTALAIVGETIEHSPNNLPVQLTSFIGREDETAEIARLLRETRLITLTGSGGCGKTRLALQVAAGEQRSFPDGVWSVDLGPLREAHLVANTIANALDIKEVPLQSFEQRLQASLQNKAMLLVLDNCEHLVDACARLVDALLRSCPSLKVMATSREPLGVAGETAWRVPSMSLPEESSSPTPDEIDRYDAVRLFIERAEKARPNFKVTEESATDLVDICRRLDGIPLAIELAAARSRLMSPEQIAQGLGDRFRLLSGGSRTAVARQQTLLASVEWSYNLLTEAEAAVLRRLAVFTGRFTLDGAEAVAADDAIPRPEVLDLLGGLVDKSLIQFEEYWAPPRYRLLETIRQYATQKLIESEEATIIRDRHLDFYVDVAEGARKDLEGRADLMRVLDSLDLDHDNLRAALEWARAADPEKGMRMARGLWGYWYTRGHYTEGSMRSEQAAAADGSPGWRARALATASLLDTAGGATVPARARAEEALALARAGDDDRILLEALYALAAADYLTNPTRSQERAAEALEVARGLGDRFYEMRATFILGLAECTAGNFSSSGRLLDETRRLHQEMNNKINLHMTLFWQAQSALQLGDLDDAALLAAEGLTAARAVQNALVEAGCLCLLAGAATGSGDYETAASVLDEVRALSARHPEPATDALWPFYVEHLNYARGELGAARSLDSSLAFFQGGGMTWLSAWLQTLQADFSRASGDLEEARARVGRAIEMARASGNPCSIGRALAAEGNLAYVTGDLDTAEDRLHEALRFLLQAGCKIDVAAALELLAEVACKSESWEEAARLFGATERLRESLGSVRFAPDIPEYQDSVKAVRANLEPSALERAWAEGEAMTLDEAVAYAARGRGERKRPSSGWKSLTPVETDVVRLVAEGLTNPEIGNRLFISPGTVKNHLSHVFAKLGISTRSELAAEAARREASKR